MLGNLLFNGAHMNTQITQVDELYNTYVYMGPIAYSKALFPDARISVLQVECQVKVVEHNSSFH